MLAIWLLALPGVLTGVLGAEVCPLVPIMPDHFMFVRDWFSFWATETVWNGQSVFSTIEQRPALFSQGRALLVMPGINVVGSSTHALCLPWNYCNFDVYDCNGELIYRGEVAQMPSYTDPSVQETVFKLTDKDGNYLGRSTELPSLMPRLGGINGKSQGALSLRDSGDSVVMELTKDPNQLFVTHWTGELDAPGMSGFDGVHSVPLADPLLIAFLISHQFRNKGLFSPAVNAVLLCLLLAVAVYLCYRWRQGDLCQEDEDARDFDLAEFNEFKAGFASGSPASLLERGCCSGNRPK